MKKLLLLIGLLLAPAWSERARIQLWRSESTLRQLGWRALWEWQGAKAALQHLGLEVQIVEEGQAVQPGLLVMANARNIGPAGVESVRAFLKGGGRLLATYQTSYRKSDNSSWSPNGLALGPELGVRFLRWNGSPGETEALEMAPPYGRIPLARHQAMLVETLPEAYVLAHWNQPSQSPAIVQRGQAIFVGEDLLAPENSRSRQVLGLVAALLNRLEPRLRLTLPRTAPALVAPLPPAGEISLAPGDSGIKVGLGTVAKSGEVLVLTAPKIQDERGKDLGKQCRVSCENQQLWWQSPSGPVALGQQVTLRGFPYLNCWQEQSNGVALWNGYRGRLQLRAVGPTIEAVNSLSMDGYLAGVIPSEVPMTFPAEALKAMAVVARTYALSHLNRHAGQDFEVCSEVHCQVYRGLGQESSATTAAVLSTQGELLHFQERLADTSFHACCGGHSVDAQATWPGAKSFPYLKGVFDLIPGSSRPDLSQETNFRKWLDSKPTGYCSLSGRYRWEENYSWSRWEALLKQALPNLESLQTVEVSRRDPSGRVAELKLSGLPQEILVQGDRVRWLTSGGKIGSGGLQSSLFYLDVLGAGPRRSLRLRGGGWGHGVGLCQEGAAGRARQGQSYQQILSHYYPGTSLSLPDQVAPIPQPVLP